MTDDDREAFGQCMALLAATYREPVDAIRTAAYWMALEELPIATVRAAVHDALRTYRFFPKPVEIRRPAMDYMRDAQVLLEAPRQLAEAVAAAAAAKQSDDRRQAAADAEAARVAALSPAERAAATEAAHAAERRRLEAWHELWAEQDRARQAHARPRHTHTRPDDQTVQRCPKCKSFRIIPDVGGEIWRCARCQTVCEE